jgi:hypothetical protein
MCWATIEGWDKFWGGEWGVIDTCGVVWPFLVDGEKSVRLWLIETSGSLCLHRKPWRMRVVGSASTIDICALKAKDSERLEV